MSINTDQINIRNAQIVTFISFLLFTFSKRASVVHFGWKETRRGQVALSWVNPDETELEVATLSLDLLCLLLTSNPTSQSENMHPLQLLRGIERHWRADEGEIWGWATSTEVHPIKTIGTGKVPPCNSFSLWIYIFDSSTFSSMTWNAKITIWWG